MVGKARFEAFSDGVFAIAITLLILEIHLPSLPAGAADVQQMSALLSLWPQYLVYAASFATIGIMWLNHHAMFIEIRQISHGTVIANLFLLGLISFLPFATEIIARYGMSPVTVVAYGIVLSLISAAYWLLQVQATRAVGKPHRLTLWNVVGLGVYPVASVLGYFVPLAGIVIFGLLAIFYMLPQNVRAATVRP